MSTKRAYRSRSRTRRTAAAFATNIADTPVQRPTIGEAHNFLVEKSISRDTFRGRPDRVILWSLGGWTATVDDICTVEGGP